MPALKYTGLIYLAAIALTLLYLLRRSPTPQALKVLGLMGVAAAPGFGWFFWNWANLGNPVFPLAFTFWEGKEWDADRARVMSLFFSHFGMGHNLKDYLLLPWRLSFDGRFDTLAFDGALGPFLLFSLP